MGRKVIVLGHYDRAGSAFASAVAQMLSSQRWQDGPGNKGRRDEGREDLEDRSRMESEFDKIWEGE